LIEVFVADLVVEVFVAVLAVEVIVAVLVVDVFVVQVVTITHGRNISLTNCRHFLLKIFSEIALFLKGKNYGLSVRWFSSDLSSERQKKSTEMF